MPFLRLRDDCEFCREVRQNFWLKNQQLMNLFIEGSYNYSSFKWCFLACLKLAPISSNHNFVIPLQLLSCKDRIPLEFLNEKINNFCSQIKIFPITREIL